METKVYLQSFIDIRTLDFTRHIAVSVLISILTLSLKKKKVAFNAAIHTK